MIDHILFTQAFVNKNDLPRVNANAGSIEHTIHEKINAGLRNAEQTSDHRPVSVEIEV